MRRRATVGLVAGAIALLVSACGGSGKTLSGGDAPEDDPASERSEEPAGPHADELVGYWDHGFEKLALHEDGTAQKWIRYYWDGRSAGSPCKLEGDLEGTWTGGDGELAITFTSGRWEDCQGLKDFDRYTDEYSYRIGRNEYEGVPILWVTDDEGTESGFDLGCADPGDCERIPEPF